MRQSLNSATPTFDIQQEGENRYSCMGQNRDWNRRMKQGGGGKWDQRMNIRGDSQNKGPFEEQYGNLMEQKFPKVHIQKRQSKRNHQITGKTEPHLMSPKEKSSYRSELSLNQVLPKVAPQNPSNKPAIVRPLFSLNNGQ